MFASDLTLNAGKKNGDGVYQALLFKGLIYFF